MKKFHFIAELTLLMFLGQAFALFAQAPEGFTYQAEARDASGKLLTTKSLTVETTILKGSSSGSVEWKKDYTVTTDNYGLFSLIIGELDGIPALTGDFSEIEWDNGTYFLNVKILWAKKWLDTGTTQLLSVPYALYAKSAGSANITETDPVFTNSPAASITDADKTKLDGLQPGWSLTGNAGTSTSTNFIGTTDNVPLTFKVNNLLSGRIDHALCNASFGYQSLASNSTGLWNMAFGEQALYSNTSGGFNTSMGYQALYNNTDGNNNLATGGYALYSNTIGGQNTANGVEALYSNRDGFDNTANGWLALYSNTSGNFNTADGVMTLQKNTTGSYNTAYGLKALAANETGSYNTAIGVFTDVSSKNLTNATAIGSYAVATDNNQVVLGNASVSTTILHGNVKHYGTTAGYVGLQAPVYVTAPYTLTLPSTAPASNGQMLSSTTDGVMSWATPTSGTVTGVSGTSPIVSSGGANPAISISAATTSSAGSMSATDKVKLDGLQSGWALAGNSGTTISNFIGTTDDKALAFKVNNQKAGEVSSGNNTSFGYQTLNSNLGINNTAYGYVALSSNTTGENNTANGFQALKANTTGNSNTAAGYNALSSNSTGGGNTANGFQALLFNTTGGYNTAIGFNALLENSGGSGNTATGFQALNFNTTGHLNIAYGQEAGRYITGGMEHNATSNNSVYLGALTEASMDGNDNEIVIGYDATGSGSNTVTLGNTSIVATILRGNVTMDGSLTVNSAGPSASYAFPTARGTSGQFLKTNADGTTAWAATTNGTVTNVTGTAPISVSNGTTTPVVSISAATSTAAGSMSSADKAKLDGLQNADGSETKVTAGTNVIVTGSGTTASPYVVNATGATTLTIGQSYQGGIIFWLDATGQHGLIAATIDQGTGILWFKGSAIITNAVRDGIGAGMYNTERIIANQGSGNYAAQLCANYQGGGYGDWYLPSQYELNLLYLQRNEVGGFVNDGCYWSSNEYNDNNAYYLYFSNGNLYGDYKGWPYNARAIRSF